VFFYNIPASNQPLQADNPTYVAIRFTKTHGPQRWRVSMFFDQVTDFPDGSMAT
jgi:hypothetical protein